jgi:hypothetical protein
VPVCHSVMQDALDIGLCSSRWLCARIFFRRSSRGRKFIKPRYSSSGRIALPLKQSAHMASPSITAVAGTSMPARSRCAAQKYLSITHLLRRPGREPIGSYQKNHYTLWADVQDRRERWFSPDQIPFSLGCHPKLYVWQYRACRAPESKWRDQAARSLFPPIERTSLQLPTKTGHFKAVFQCFSRVRSTESSEVMERAMGIELYSQILSLNNARRCRHSKGQLVPSGAKPFGFNIVWIFVA